jgi:hypothetical protein
MGTVASISAVGLYLAWTVTNGMIAVQKGRSRMSCSLASLLFSPFLVWCYLVAVPALPKETSATSTSPLPSRAGSTDWVCAKCQARNVAASDKCSSCGAWPKWS